MSADSNGSRRPHDPSEPRTEAQSDEQLAVSAKLSTQYGTADPSAPKVAGFTLTRLLGEGAYGQVWHAWQNRTGKEVALKLFTRRSGLDWILLQREVERLAQLDRHPHIVSLLDVNLENEPPYYVMDLLQHGSLHQFVSPQTTAAPEAALRWMGEICDALSYVHAKGLIHCDLKPANILLDGRDHVRVLDFGQSRVFTESAASLGTLFYMAPEQAVLSQPGKPVQPDVRWDVYALGGTMYALLSGLVPNSDDKIQRLLSDAPSLAERLRLYRDHVYARSIEWPGNNGKAVVGEELKAIVLKCLEPKPEGRYRTVDAVAEDLTALSSNRPVTPLASSTSYRARKFVQRNPLRLGLAGAVVLLAASAYVVRSLGIAVDHSAAERLAAQMVYEPAAAISSIGKAQPRVKQFLNALCGEYVQHPAYTLRIMGARTAPLVARAELWKSIDGGALWNHGEWVEVAGVPWNDDGIAKMLSEKAANGSPREKYVAFCLLGQVSRGANDVFALCKRAIESESQPGVIAAAWWAAAKLGAPVDLKSGEAIRLDNHSGGVFARLPAITGFKPGSPPDEPGRSSDEQPPANVVDIPALWMGTTEVTVAQFERFLNSKADALKEIAAHQLDALKTSIDRQPRERRSRVAVGLVSPILAQRYCQWLTQTAGQAGVKATYRLPSEVEWEAACRAGHATAFSWGDSESYFQYFGADYSAGREFETATRMPNAYGLFDMHGNVWEICDSPWCDSYDGQPAAGEQRIVQRGGAAYNKPTACRSAQRNYMAADAASDRVGFRLVMEMDGGK
jgi:serine/threonine protein kinase/formylglycine-generating enzyme required for sulfatase activity